MSMFDILIPTRALIFTCSLFLIRRCNGYDLNKLREDTSLRRKMKQFVLNGGKPGMGMGYLDLKKALE